MTSSQNFKQGMETLIMHLLKWSDQYKKNEDTSKNYLDG